MARDVDDFPRGTPLFGKCILCGDVLPYPPVQISRSVRPSENEMRYEIVWDRHCIRCAIRKLKKLSEKSLVPQRAWIDGRTGRNPFWRK